MPAVERITELDSEKNMRFLATALPQVRYGKIKKVLAER